MPGRCIAYAFNNNQNSKLAIVGWREVILDDINRSIILALNFINLKNIKGEVGISGI